MINIEGIKLHYKKVANTTALVLWAFIKINQSYLTQALQCYLHQSVCELREGTPESLPGRQSRKHWTKAQSTSRVRGSWALGDWSRCRACSMKLGHHVCLDNAIWCLWPETDYRQLKQENKATDAGTVVPLYESAVSRTCVLSAMGKWANWPVCLQHVSSPKSWEKSC